MAEGAGLRVVGVVVERGDVIDDAVATAGGEPSIALCPWEGEVAGTEVPYLALVELTVCIFFVHAPVIDGMVVEMVDGAGCLSGDGPFGEAVLVGAEKDMVALGTFRRCPLQGDAPVVGIGECAPLPALSCDDRPDYSDVLRRFCDDVQLLRLLRLQIRASSVSMDMLMCYHLYLRSSYQVLNL